MSVLNYLAKYIQHTFRRVFVLIASKARGEDGLYATDVMQPVSRSNSHQQLDTKSSQSNDSLTSSSSSHQRRSVSPDVIHTSPFRHTTANDVMTTAARVTSVQSVSNERRTAAVAQPDVTSSAGGAPVRRRAVNLSDLRSCALVQTQLKTRNTSAVSWRYVLGHCLEVINVFCTPDVQCARTTTIILPCRQIICKLQYLAVIELHAVKCTCLLSYYRPVSHTYV